MRRAGLLFSGMLAILGVADAQELEPLRKSYTDAVTAWENGDPALEGELFRRPADEMTKRIAEDAARHDALVQAKKAYLGALASRLRAAAAELRRPLPQKPAPQDFNSTMLRDVETVLSMLQMEGTNPKATPPIRPAALQRLKAPIVELQLLLADRQRNLDRVPAPPDAPANLTNAADALANAAAGLENAIAGVDREGAQWRELYSTMQREVARTSARDQAPAAPPEDTSVAYAGTAVLPGVAGDWRPESADGAPFRVKITQSGAEVRGSVETADGRRFEFGGTIRSPYMRFGIAAPLKGWVVIQRLSATKIRVAYEVQGGKKAGIQPERVPENKPVELNRAND